jgi:predicted nucleic acid-binding protein
MYLLDSNVISELRSATRCDPRVRAWEAQVSLAACLVSVVSFYEIRMGIDQVARRDSKFSGVLACWLEERVKPAFEDRALLVSAAIAERAGAIAALRTRSMADCLIAATALEHRLTLVTRNVADFDDVEGLEIINPWNHS